MQKERRIAPEKRYFSIEKWPIILRIQGKFRHFCGECGTGLYNEFDDQPQGLGKTHMILCCISIKDLYAHCD